MHVSQEHNVQVRTLVGTCETAPVFVGYFTRVGVQATSWGPAPIQVKASRTESGTYTKVVNHSGVAVSAWATGNFAMALPSGWEPFKYIRICSASNDTGVDQTNAALIVTIKA